MRTPCKHRVRVLTLFLYPRAVRTWWPKEPPQQWLVPAVLSAATVTALSDVEELVPFGHELGIGASGLGFAYVTGWIFNWLVIEQPRRQALQRL
jgi:hypothetical protein